MKQDPWHIAVLIPARNEEKLLARCLNAVIEACTVLPTSFTYDIILIVDSSTDRTFEIGQSILETHGRVVHVNAKNVGWARKVAAETALKRYKGPLHRCWFANTDADSEVPHTWITKQIEKANLNIEAIAGIIDVDNFVDHDLNVPKRFRETYLIGQDGSHPHVHGANLGIRADCYTQVGGWSYLETAEDHDLWNRLMRSNHLTIKDADLCVITSGRKKGRAPDGFAERLAAHNGYAYV